MKMRLKHYKPLHWIVFVLMLIQLPICSAQSLNRGKSAFFIEGYGGLFKQGDEGTVYSLADADTNSDVPIGPLQRVSPRYKLSGGAAFGFLSKDGTDISLSFLVNHHKKSDSIANSDLIDHVDITLLPAAWQGIDEGDFAGSTFLYRNNLYNLIVGHWLLPSSGWLLHPYLGVHLADIKLRQNTEYVGSSGAVFNAFVQERSAVVGVGPLVGVNTVYNLFGDIGLVGNLGIGVLTGKIRSSYAAQVDDSANGSIDRTSYVESKTGMSVFELIHAKLGFSYAFPTTGQFGGHVALGYQLTEYIGASASHAFPDSQQQGLSLHLFEESSFAGPFLSVQVNLL